MPPLTCLLKYVEGLEAFAAGLQPPPADPPFASSGPEVVWTTGLLLGPRPEAPAPAPAAEAPAVEQPKEQPAGRPPAVEQPEGQPAGLPPAAELPPLLRPGVGLWPAGWDPPPAPQPLGQCTMLEHSNPADK